MKTKRTKMMITSIAMLLVALVALGSATYAWYTVNRNVKANNFVVSATSPGGLVISATDSNYSANDLDLNVDAELTPATMAYTFENSDITVTPTTKYSTGAENDWGADGSTVNATTDQNLTYYIAKDVWVKNENSRAGYVQLKVGTINNGTWATVANTFMRIDVIDVTAGSNAVVATTVSHSAAGTNTEIELAANTARHYKVVVYADGTDSNCNTTNAKTNATTDCTFALAFNMNDTASQTHTFAYDA